MKYLWLLLLNLILATFIGCEKETEEEEEVIVETDDCDKTVEECDDPTIDQPEGDPDSLGGSINPDEDDDEISVSVSAISPDAAPTAGGTQLTLTGKGFKSGLKIKIGGEACEEVGVLSSTKARCTAPALSHGSHDVVTTIGKASDKLTDGYSALNPASISIEYDTTSIDFGAFGLNKGGSSRSLTFTNDGELPAQQIEGNSLEAPFYYSGIWEFPGYSSEGCESTLAPGDSCKVVLAHYPSEEGSVNATFVFSYSNGVTEKSLSVSLTGEGIPSGDLEPGFGTDGIYSNDMVDDGLDEFTDVIPTADYGLLTVGHYDGGDFDLGQMVLRKTYLNGQGYYGFGTDGESKITPGNCTLEASSGKVVQADDGNYFVAFHCWDSSFTSSPAVVKIKADGSVDTTWGTDGIVEATVSNSKIAGIAIDSEDNIIVAGYEDDASDDFFVFRVTSAGALDTSFDSDGLWKEDLGSNIEQARAVLVDDDDNIYVFGTNDADMLILKLDSDGNEVAAFGSSGVKTIDTSSGGKDGIFDAGFDSNGMLVLAGQSDNLPLNMAVVRIDPADGSLDTTFDSDGIASYIVGDSSKATSLVIDGSDNYILGGYDFTSAGGYRPMIVRFTKTGLLDTTFSDDGYEIYDDGVVSSITAMTADILGRYVSVGYREEADEVSLETFMMSVWH